MIGVALGGVGVWLRMRRHTRAYAPALVIPGVPTLLDAMPAFERELARARRYKRPASALALDVSSTDLERLRLGLLRRNGAAAAAFERLQVQNVLQARLAAMLHPALRETDVAAFDSKQGLFFVLLPEADRTHAEATAKRLQEAFLAATGASLLAGAAQFPDEELLVGELLSRAATGIGIATSRPLEQSPGAEDPAVRVMTGGNGVIHKSAGSH